MKRLLAFIILSALTLCFGCGTIAHGKLQMIFVNSDPPGALVTVSGYKMETPSIAVLDRNHNHTLTLTKKGYKSKEIVLSKHFNFFTALVGNLPSAWLGVLVDHYTGSAYKLSPNEIQVTLEKDPTVKKYFEK